MSDTSRYIPEHRRQQHKGRNQFRVDELRRRREDQQVEIRKQKKEENLAKRRNLDSRVQEWDDASGDTSESDDDNSTLNRKVTMRPPAPCRIRIRCEMIFFVGE
jgi:importin subunit alpha-6/7